MARHVDTTRPEDVRDYTRLARWERELLTGVSTPSHVHRKGDTVTTDVRVMLDVWSGNPDTDRAWAHAADRRTHLFNHIPAVDYRNCDTCARIVHPDN